MAGKGQPKTGGRKKGTPNKTTALLKDAILMAAEQAGAKDGMVGYLKQQALEKPAAFLALLGKVLPTQRTDTSAIEDNEVIISFMNGDQKLDRDPLQALPLQVEPMDENEATQA